MTKSRLKRIAIGLGAATLLAWAIVLGWFMHDWLGSEQVVVSVDRPVQVYAPEEVTSGKVPNVLGLSEDDARRALGDAGVEPEAVSVKQVPYVGPEDLVVRQTPAAGGSIGAGRVVLAVSTAALMPDLQASPEGRARAALSDLGARVTIETEYQPGAEEGTVLSSLPAPGQPIEDTATLVVAEPLSSVYVTQLAPLASSCRSEEEGLVAGVNASSAVICLPEPGANPRFATYTLGGQVESFQAVLGLDDSGSPELPVDFRVDVDGQVELERRVSFGDRVPVKVPLLGKFQLKLEASTPGVAGGEAGGLPVKAVFAEPRLVGSRSAVDRLAGGLEE